MGLTLNQHVSLDPRHTHDARYDDPVFRQVFATLVVHYWTHAAFTPLLEGVHRIAHLPAVLIHGRLGVSGPLSTAWQLHKRWPNSELVVVEDEGHGGDAMVEAAVRAVARFAPRR